ncbi:hypothetical protein HAX54_017407, partial [Datura stramonium]|nr:hypothetical protein [Datura stramonium]
DYMVSRSGSQPSPPSRPPQTSVQPLLRSKVEKLTFFPEAEGPENPFHYQQTDGGRFSVSSEKENPKLKPAYRNGVWLYNPLK